MTKMNKGAKMTKLNRAWDSSAPDVLQKKAFKDFKKKLKIFHKG